MKLMIPDFLLDECPSREENIRSLLESVTKEEVALAKIIGLEAEKINEFIGNSLNFPYANSPDDILKFIRSTKKINDLIAQKCLFLQQKHQNILLLEEEFLKEEEED